PFARASAFRHTTELDVGIAGGDDDLVELFIAVHFIEERDVGDGEGVLPGIERREPLVDRTAYGGMHDLLEILARGRIGEHDRAELLAIHLARGRDDRLA